LEAAEQVRKIVKARESILAEVSKAIVGQEAVVDGMLTAIFSRGHVILEGVPGLAKTLMINTLSKALDLDFKRIQFTPDLMPGDITGTEILQDNKVTGEREFTFVKGPVFANIVLADEINRTPPKTQAALLQAMQEYSVTTGGNTWDLELPFFVLATQNPIEQEGTYPLPEAQLDRFMFKLRIDYPDFDDEVEIVKATTGANEVSINKVLTVKEIIEIQDLVRQVPVSDHIARYAVALVSATRPGTDRALDFVNDWVSWGAGPRAAQCLLLGGKARALIHGRYAVSAEDIRAIACPVLRHRLVTNFNAEADGKTTDDIVNLIISEIPEEGTN
jgi:MoxR-like ATPase